MIDEENTDLWGNDIPWLHGLREKGRRAWNKAGLPDAQNEAWKYTYSRLSNFDGFVPDFSIHDCSDCHHSAIHNPIKAYDIFLCNGRPHLHKTELPAGLTIKPLLEAIYDGEVKSYLNKSFDVEQFPFAALNTAYLEQGLFIVIERGTVLPQPIYLHYHQHDTEHHLNCIRNIIVVENKARATIIEDFSAEDEAVYANNIVNEIFIAADSGLRHYKIQNEASPALHIALNSVQVRQNGIYESFCSMGECFLARHESYINLLQSDARAEINGIYRLRNNGLSDITANIRHLAPHTYSDLLVKGVVDGTAKGVFQGQIHIAPDSQQCEGNQQHRALLLSDTAEISCKPELEIYADDVKCSHGAASGDLDVEQLFYMQSRGIDLEQARQILITAYLDEVTNKIGCAEIKELLRQKI